MRPLNKHDIYEKVLVDAENDAYDALQVNIVKGAVEWLKKELCFLPIVIEKIDVAFAPILKKKGGE